MSTLICANVSYKWSVMLLVLFMMVGAACIRPLSCSFHWDIIRLLPSTSRLAESEFDSNLWKGYPSSTDRPTDPSDPLIGSGHNKERMAVELVNYGLLLGMTVEQVRRLLGHSDFEVDENKRAALFRTICKRPYLMIYETSVYYLHSSCGGGRRDSVQLLVYFDNGKVACTKIQQGTKYRKDLYKNLY